MAKIDYEINEMNETNEMRLMDEFAILHVVTFIGFYGAFTL